MVHKLQATRAATDYTVARDTPPTGVIVPLEALKTFATMKGQVTVQWIFNGCYVVPKTILSRNHY